MYTRSGHWLLLVAAARHLIHIAYCPCSKHTDGSYNRTWLRSQRGNVFVVCTVLSVLLPTLLGITADEPHLKQMAARITDHALTSAAFEAHGIQSLQNRIRTTCTDGGAAVSDVDHGSVRPCTNATCINSVPKQTGELDLHACLVMHGLDLCAYWLVAWTGFVCLLSGSMNWICVLAD